MDLINSIPNNIFEDETIYTSTDELQQFLHLNGLKIFHTNIRSLANNLDININILPNNITNLGQTYLDTLMRHNFISCINQPTRFDLTHETLTCIDHILFRPNKPTDIQNIKTSVIHTNITDHYSTIATIESPNYSNNKTDPIKTRNYLNYDLLTENISKET